MLRYHSPPGRIGALEGGAHVSTEARVFSRHHARGAFDVDEGCAKASKQCNCDNRTSDFPKDDAGSVLSRVLINAQIAAPLWLPKKLLAIVVDQEYNSK
jgi:hypothetical protein